MLKIILICLIAVHGLLHFIGFIKAYKFSDIPQLVVHYSKSIGNLWFLAAVLFLVSSLFLFIDNEIWSYIVIIAVVLSQYLVGRAWKDAKFASIANLLIVILAIILV
ncbi:hypothetical protein BH10BAC5_BH10BAC5_15880 [soil metagenome]